MTAAVVAPADGLIDSIQELDGVEFIGEPAVRISDPYSHTGQGGQVDIAPSPEMAETSRRAVVEFFRKSFGLVP